MLMTRFIPYKLNIGWYSEHYNRLNVRAPHIIGSVNTNFGLKTLVLNIARLELFMNSVSVLISWEHRSFITAYVELTDVHSEIFTRFNSKLSKF